MANTYAGYGVYYYDAQKVGHGMAGRVADNGSAVTTSPDLKTGLNGDPVTQAFATSSSALRLAVTDRISNSASDNVGIYDASSGSVLTTITGGWPGVTNLYAVVHFGSFLYALDYDHARVVQINPSTYAETGVSYTLPSSLNPDPSLYTAYGQALFTANNGTTTDLYGLFIFMNPTTFAFASTSLLVKFTISGSSITVGSNDHNSSFASNTVATVSDGGTGIYTAAIGGSQGTSYNAGSAIQFIDLSAGPLGSGTVTTFLSPSASYPYNFLDISTDAAGNFYILGGVYNSSFTGLNGLLQKTDFSTFTTIDTISSVPGFCWAAQYTTDNNRIWYARGNDLRIYNAASTASPVATLSIGSGTPSWNLISPGELYDSLNGFSYVDASIALFSRGLQSPVQVSNAPRAQRARAITQGRPVLTDEELALLDGELGAK